jgi:hypothetical protein
MAGKQLDLNEAAAKLGISPDQLSEMRQRGDVYAMRAGGGWMFKEEEIERVLAERAGGSGGVGGDLDDLIKPMDLDDDSDDDLGSILVSEQELGKSGESTSSTVIGKTVEPKGGADSDITLAGDSDKHGSSDVQLVKPGSDLNLATTSDVDLAAQSDLKLAGEGGTGKAGSDVSLGSGKLDFATDSALDLGDDDLVLGGSGIGSDVTLGGGDSGINLASPADSGLSLEQEPVDLMGGSNVDASFELPEDDDVISLSSDLASDEEATQLKADEEFLLSPAGDLGGDESDSGSQVIALEDSEAFDENADTMLRPAQPALVVEDVGAGFDQVTTMTPGAMPAATQQYMTTAAPEAPYTIWNVMGLMCCVFLLSITGMLMTDLMRNMWAFDSDRVMSTGLMDSILSAVGMK